MPRRQLVMRTVAAVALLSAAVRAQAPISPTVPPTTVPPTTVPPTTIPPTTVPPTTVPGTTIPPAPTFATPQLSAPPPAFDPYALPSSMPPTLPPTLAPATTTYPPGQAPIATPVFPAATPVVATPRRGFYGGFEAAVLEPKVGTLRIAEDLTPLLIPEELAALRLIRNGTDYDLTFSPRVWGGYMGPKGFGGRIQWWYMDAKSKFSELTMGDDTVSLQSRLKYNIFDFEATQMGALQSWQFELGGGVRYGRIDQSVEAVLSEPNRSAELGLFERLDGVGPTVSFSAKRPIGNWEGLTFVGKTRYSILFGDANLDAVVTGDDIDLPDLDLFQVSDATWTSWEISVGALWTRILQGGAVFNLGAFLEGQVWDPDNHGFFGPTFHVSISR